MTTGEIVLLSLLAVSFVGNVVALWVCGRLTWGSLALQAVLDWRTKENLRLQQLLLDRHRATVAAGDPNTNTGG